MKGGRKEPLYPVTRTTECLICGRLTPVHPLSVREMALCTACAVTEAPELVAQAVLADPEPGCLLRTVRSP